MAADVSLPSSPTMQQTVADDSTIPSIDSSRGPSFSPSIHEAFARTDFTALEYLGKFLKEIQSLHPNCVALPLKTRPDGNCLLHAASVSIWGDESRSITLRSQVASELKQNEVWYTQNLEKAHPGCGRAEFAEALLKAETDRSFLSNIHMIALACVLRRPVVFLASQPEMANLGVGYHGCAGMFLPVRWLEEEEAGQPGCAPRLLGGCRPVVLAWGSAVHDHYVAITMVQPTEAALSRLVGFPVPTPIQVEHGLGHVDPFCPPFIPQLWADCLCRSCTAEYTGCWDMPYSATTQSTVPSSNAAHGVEVAVDSLTLLRHSCSDPVAYSDAIATLQRVVANLLKQPVSEENRVKYRTLNLENQKLHSLLGQRVGGFDVLRAIGFCDSQQQPKLILEPKNEDSNLVATVAAVLTSCQH